MYYVVIPAYQPDEKLIQLLTIMKQRLDCQAIVVADGRTEESQGLSLYQMAEVLKAYGAQTAYNLDGGGSSTLYFNGQVINKPTTNGNTISEREVSDIVYIGY